METWTTCSQAWKLQKRIANISEEDDEEGNSNGPDDREYGDLILLIPFKTFTYFI